MTVDLVVRDAIIVSPAGRQRGDLLVDEGRVAGIVAPGSGEGKRVTDASGLHLLPGAVDPHVHLQDPGLTHQETFTTGTSAAAVGGVTTVVEHHRSVPFVLNVDILRDKAQYLADRGLIDYALFGGIEPDNMGQIEPMWEAGAAAFKIFTCTVHHVTPVYSDGLLEAFNVLARLDAPVLIHCEDDPILQANEARLRAEGRQDFGVVTRWRTREAEQVAVRTVALLARATGARVIVAHASHPAICDLVNEERGRGAQIWVESCPQYFYLDEEMIEEIGPWMKFTPPARDRAAADAMWQRLVGGDIDMICADHAPSTKEEKSAGLENIFEAPFGVPGVETTYPLMLNGASRGLVSLERLVAVRSEIPARVYGLWPRKGNLNVGADADFILVDMDAQRTLRNEEIVAKVGWTPYEGLQITGLPVQTFVRGRLVAQDGRPVAEPGWGNFIPGPGYKE